VTRNRAIALAALVAISIYLIVVGCFALVHVIHEHEECGGVSSSVCRGLRESDERECRAGQGCGQPLPGRKR
jgi:hypothetical protein